MDEVRRLATVCERLGAPPAQAEAMARQLLKRAGQIAAERGQSREEALDRLLRLAIQGRSGQVPPEFQPPDARNSSDKSAK
ncbi:MAG TPA: hypothetical protein VEB66_09965 [Opitutaceae bacterium]|nr:hypothetical protein [Opitutaceae bacterium]